MLFTKNRILCFYVVFFFVPFIFSEVLLYFGSFSDLFFNIVCNSIFIPKMKQRIIMGYRMIMSLYQESILFIVHNRQIKIKKRNE